MRSHFCVPYHNFVFEGHLCYTCYSNLVQVLPDAVWIVDRHGGMLVGLC